MDDGKLLTDLGKKLTCHRIHHKRYGGADTNIKSVPAAQKTSAVTLLWDQGGMYLLSKAKLSGLRTGGEGADSTYLPYPKGIYFSSTHKSQNTELKESKSK